MNGFDFELARLDELDEEDRNMLFEEIGESWKRDSSRRKQLSHLPVLREAVPLQTTPPQSTFTSSSSTALPDAPAGSPQIPASTTTTTTSGPTAFDDADDDFDDDLDKSILQYGMQTSRIKQVTLSLQKKNRKKRPTS